MVWEPRPPQCGRGDPIVRVGQSWRVSADISSFQKKKAHREVGLEATQEVRPLGRQLLIPI